MKLLENAFASQKSQNQIFLLTPSRKLSQGFLLSTPFKNYEMTYLLG